MKWLCKIFGHKWHFDRSKAEVADYEKWGRTYTYQVEGDCTRCGHHQTLYFKEGGAW